MPKPKVVWIIRPMVAVLIALCFLISFGTIFLGNWIITGIDFALSMFAAVYVMVNLRSSQRDIYKFLSTTADVLDLTNKKSLASFPLPSIMLSDTGEILWYNNLFYKNILKNSDAYGERIYSLFSEFSFDGLSSVDGIDLVSKNKHYTANGVSTKTESGRIYTAFFREDTELKIARQELEASKPCIFMITIDNYDELFQNSKDSDKTRIAGEIENIFEQFTQENSGLLRRLNRDRYIAIIEERYMEKIVGERFSILDKVREVVASSENRLNATLSIGVGRGADSYVESEQMAKQALEMALGRGGDQAAVKTPEGFDFYGGVSKGIEKRTKVKTRIIASAMTEIIDSCSNCILMGHKLADLDCFGACVGMASAVKRMGKHTVIAIDKENNLVSGLMNSLSENGYADMFMSPEEALETINDKTLLIIADTHVPKMLESIEIYQKCKHIFVIDHHRRAVGFIDNAVIFFHEPYASSASEMVTELIQYFEKAGEPTQYEAEALLAGIALDTKNFIVKTGVRTFEAAAYLRKNGADMVEVKKLFSSSIESYEKKAKIVSQADIFHGCAVVASDMTGNDMRIIVPQSADELLSITGVVASFVMYNAGKGIQISARSMGEVNVQLIMERLGGGGHLTMAGALVKDDTLENVRTRLIREINLFREESKERN